MTQIKIFTFNAFQENTYVLSHESQAWIIDPGCSDGNERKMLDSYLKKEGLQPQLIINTHCHIDHVLGNKWCKEKYDIPLWIPDGEQIVLESLKAVSAMYGVSAEPSPEPDHFMKEEEIMNLGGIEWQLISAPGHSPGSICFYQMNEKILIAGDVLFFESIGRTDLPGGKHQLLLDNIHQKILTLPDDVMVYPGHGPHTTIGHEKYHNPFLI
ncbi:MAG: MBL fold metallo-hydrolase [Saprospiraceae bacterium]